jgi:imidazolonepropionase-like amidohydrolase
MVQVGLTPDQALRAATVTCADLMAWTDTLDRLAPGKEADIVLLERHPCEDVSATWRARHVFKAGKH